MVKKTKRTNGKKRKMTLKKRVAMNKIRHTKHRLVKSPVYTGGVSVFNFSKKKSQIVPTDSHHIEGDGYVYDGEIKNGKFNGKGIYKFNKEIINGKDVWNVYDGDFKDDKFNGEGEITYKNGDIYKGKYKNDFLDGPGTLKFNKEIIDGKEVYDVYEGNYNYAQKNGQGKITYKNGDIYEGNFDNDKINGPGKITYKNGDIYKGNFENGYYSGQGILKMTYNDETSIYLGNFENGSRNGHGIFYFNKQEINDKDDVWDVYEGEFKNDQFNGQGKITYANGNVKEGKFKESRITGKYVIIYNLKNEDVKRELKNYIKPENENKENEKLFIRLVNHPKTEKVTFYGEENIKLTGHFVFKNEEVQYNMQYNNKELTIENIFVFTVIINGYDKFSHIKLSDIGHIHKEDVEPLTDNTELKFPKETKRFFKGSYYGTNLFSMKS